MNLNLPTRLSESVLWNLQTAAYFQFGIDSWTQKGVPFHITNNSLIAKQYAEVALPLFDQGPVTFLEIGAGSGKFAYLFILELLAFGIPEGSIRYLLTDFAEKNVMFCQNHPLFIPLIERGIVVPLVYDPLTAQSLPFVPSFVIANYFFDTIPQDLFRKKEGLLEEGLVSVFSEGEGGLHTPDSISKLVLDYSYKPIDLKHQPYFDSSELNKLLDLYQQQISNGLFLFPSHGIKALSNLVAVCNPSFTLLAADWGAASNEPFRINLHGTFSFPVDFQALALFFLQKKGDALINRQGSSRFAVALFSTAKISGPSRQFFTKQHFGILEKKEASFTDLLQYLAEANWDVTLFFCCFEAFEKFYQSATHEDKLEFLQGCKNIQPRFYPLFREEARLLDRLALFLEGLDQKKEAKALFERALLFCGLPQQENNLAILQIGQPPLGVPLPQGHLTQVTLNLASVQPLGSFDLILFFPLPVEKPEAPKLGIIQQIEEQFGFLKELVYTDADLHEFLSQVESKSPKYLIEFFLNLKRDGQISSSQLEMVFDHLEKRGLISATDRTVDTSPQSGVDYFEILLCALKYHMKRGGVLKAAFPPLFKDDRLFNQIVVDPYLEYKEESSFTSMGEEFLWVTIEKLSSV